MSKSPPPGFESDDSDRRYSRWNPWPEVGRTSQNDTSHPYPSDDVYTYIPGLDYRPGQRQ
jgi:hypothetical protein